MERVAFWSDDTVHRVTATSRCDCFESDGIIAANSDEERCGSCFYFMTDGCHNASISGLRMAAAGVKTSERLCLACKHGCGGSCSVVDGDADMDSMLTARQFAEVERYVSVGDSGMCPAFSQVVHVAAEEDEEYDLDTALFMGGLW